MIYFPFTQDFLNVDIDDENLVLMGMVITTAENSAVEGADILNQSPAALTKKYDGYGLGLDIVKEVVKLHRGPLGFNKNDSKTVTFQLQFQPE